MRRLNSRVLSRTTALLAVALAATLASTSAATAGVAGAAATTPNTQATQALALTATTTTLTTSRNPAYTAQAGGITARVKGTPALGVPTGSVDFYVDGQWWWTEILDATGRARLAYANVEPGTHTVSATYSGDANYDTSTSATLTQTVLATAPTTTLAYTPASVAPGGVSRLVLSATNQTPVNMPNLGMGVLLPAAGVTVVSTPPGVGCRRAWPNLFYCLTSARPGVTRKIVIDVTAPATSTLLTTSGYSRNIDTMEETGATATLTVG